MSNNCIQAEKLFVDYEKPLLRYANKILKNSADAQDVVQKIFIKVLGMSEEPHSLKSYLYRGVHNLCCDYLRKQNRYKEVDCDISELFHVAGKTDIANEFVQKEESEIMRKLIDSLDEKKRSIIIMKIDSGLSYREIGSILQMSESNVGAVLCQTLKKIRKEFKTICCEIGKEQ